MLEYNLCTVPRCNLIGHQSMEELAMSVGLEVRASSAANNYSMS